MRDRPAQLESIGSNHTRKKVTKAGQEHIEKIPSKHLYFSLTVYVEARSENDSSKRAIYNALLKSEAGRDGRI